MPIRWFAAILGNLSRWDRQHQWPHRRTSGIMRHIDHSQVARVLWMMVATITISACGTSSFSTPHPITLTARPFLSGYPNPTSVTDSIRMSPSQGPSAVMTIPTPTNQTQVQVYPNQVTDLSDCDHMSNEPSLAGADAAVVAAAFGETQLAGHIAARLTTEGSICQFTITAIGYTVQLELNQTPTKELFAQQAQTLQALVRELQQHPSLNYPLSSLSIYWDFGTVRCGWIYEQATKIKTGDFVWYRVEASTVDSDTPNAICDAAIDPPSEYCLRIKFPEPLVEQDIAVLQAALDHAHIQGSVRGMRGRDGTTCVATTIWLGYHFLLEAPDAATPQQLEQRAAQIQTLVLDLRNHPSLNAPLATMVITWQWPLWGCSWAFDYAAHGDQQIWYPRWSAYLNAPTADQRGEPTLCSPRNITGSSIPKPQHYPLYQCTTPVTHNYYPLRRREHEEIVAAFKQAGIEASLQTAVDGEGTECSYAGRGVRITATIPDTMLPDPDLSSITDRAYAMQAVLEPFRTRGERTIETTQLALHWNTGETRYQWIYAYDWHTGADEKGGMFKWELREKNYWKP